MRRFALATIVALAALGSLPITSIADHDFGPERVYFPQTGQYLRDPFLSIWRHEGGVQVFGYPISREIVDGDVTAQYFERAILEEDAGAPEGFRVQARLLGIQERDEHFRRVPFQPGDAPEDVSVRFFPETGHALGGGFLEFWEEYGGLPVFGFPISTEFHERGMRVQYFERAVFEMPTSGPDEWTVILRRLGAAAAINDGIDRSVVVYTEREPIYDPALWWAPTPHPRDPTGVSQPLPGAPSHLAKWIEVDKTNQVLRAWEGNRVVFAAIISTGLPLSPTLNGTFQTYWHLTTTRMQGTSPYSGEYDLPNVPFVMYYSGGYGLHGTYWHSNFGRPQSNGCVNLTRADAEWLFYWSPLGTTVWVHGTTPGGSV